MKKTLLLAGVACIMGASQAQAMMKVDPYIGMDYVYSDMDMSKGRDHNLENKFNSLSLNAGAKLHENFGVEVYYQQSDTEKKHGNNSRFYSYGIDAMGYLPVAENVDLIASVGLGQYEFRAGGDEDDLGYRFGLGAQYSFNDNWAARAMVREVLVDSNTMDDMLEFSAGVRYSF